MTKRNNDPTYIKRPENSWFQFLREWRGVKGKRNDPREARVVWRAMSEAEKEPYEIKAKEEKAEHQRLHPGYKFQPKKGNREEAKVSSNSGDGVRQIINQPYLTTAKNKRSGATRGSQHDADSALPHNGNTPPPYINVSPSLNFDSCFDRASTSNYEASTSASAAGPSHSMLHGRMDGPIHRDYPGVHYAGPHSPPNTIASWGNNINDFNPHYIYPPSEGTDYSTLFGGEPNHTYTTTQYTPTPNDQRIFQECLDQYIRGVLPHASPIAKSPTPSSSPVVPQIYESVPVDMSTSKTHTFSGPARTDGLQYSPKVPYPSAKHRVVGQAKGQKGKQTKSFETLEPNLFNEASHYVPAESAVEHSEESGWGWSSNLPLFPAAAQISLPSPGYIPVSHSHTSPPPPPIASPYPTVLYSSPTEVAEWLVSPGEDAFPLPAFFPPISPPASQILPPSPARSPPPPRNLSPENSGWLDVLQEPMSDRLSDAAIYDRLLRDCTFI